MTVKKKKKKKKKATSNLKLNEFTPRSDSYSSFQSVVLTTVNKNKIK